MCGIMGVLQKEKDVDQRVLHNMMKILWHRGPDDNGVEILSFGGRNNLGVAFDRLSIRDLSQKGHQPMWTTKKDIMIAFNGEIYNSEELRPNLIAKGYEFQGNSDTEVLINLYHCYGIEMVNMLDGMFAICLYDSRINKLFLIRDRIGEKPLYIYESGDLFMFASEYKAFYCHPEFKPELNQDAVNEYFVFRYLTANRTFLQNVNNLAPGHYMEIEMGGVKTILKYWEIPESKPNSLSFEQNKENVKALISKSLQRRMISDRPLGLQLSGGVDSSYIAYLAQERVNEPIHSFGVTFANEKFSEEKYIDFVNQKVGCVPHKIEFSVDDFIECWKRSIWYFDSPQNLPGTLGLLKLNREAQKFVTVILCGDGPDEMMGGYNRFANIAREMDSTLRGRLLHYIRCVADRFLRRPVPREFSNEKYYVNCFRFISESFFERLFPERGRRVSRKVVKERLDKLRSTPGKGIRRFMNYEMTTYMQDILMRSDKLSMASSVELRVPYLMPELIEYSTTIPDDQLVDGAKHHVTRHTKKIMKKISEEVFGEDFAYRDKMGFSFPLMDYFTTKSVEDYLEGLMAGIKRRGLVNYDFFEELWEKRHYYKKNGHRDTRSIIYTYWCVFSFEIWAEMFLDENPINSTEFCNERVNG